MNFEIVEGLTPDEIEFLYSDILERGENTTIGASYWCAQCSNGTYRCNRFKNDYGCGSVSGREDYCNYDYYGGISCNCGIGVQGYAYCLEVR